VKLKKSQCLGAQPQLWREPARQSLSLIYSAGTKRQADGSKRSGGSLTIGQYVVANVKQPAAVAEAH
jgi:hypothetical protein